MGVKPIVEKSHPGEGILLKNLRSKVTNDEVKMLRYMYKVPSSVEIRASKAFERIDWVMPGWTTLYELMFKDGIRLLIPKLKRDVCEHYEITPSQLMSNAWRILLALESLSVRNGVECEIGEVLFSYYLKEHDTDKGRYQLTMRVGRVPIFTCLHTNDRS